MLQHRIWPMLGLSLMTSTVAQAAWSDPVGNAPVYLCQFGGTVTSYTVQLGEDGRWQGVGSLDGWNIMTQDNGLVARNGDQLLVIGEGPDSLVQDGQVLAGECVDTQSVLAQPFDSSRPGAGTPDPATSDQTELFGGSADADMLVAGILSIFDPDAWDEDKVAAVVDSLALDRALKIRLKDELRAAGRDPVRVGSLARQIQRAIVLEAAASADLRARLQETRNDLAQMTDAYQQQRARSEELSQQLAAAKARASAAEKAQKTTTAKLEATQRSLREKDAELARVSRENAALRQQVTGLQGHVRELQAALDRTMAEQQDTNTEVAALIQQLTETRARLARANKKIEELQGVRN